MSDQGSFRANSDREGQGDAGLSSPTPDDAANSSNSNGRASLDLETLPGHRMRLSSHVALDCGIEFGPITVAYQTYGELNSERSNAILVCHALTGDQFAAEPHPHTGKDGWLSLIHI